MAYTVLARKYRSRTFDDVVGQEPIAATLANAIRAERVHHGYLFTGTRGTGKTSMARILAKSLNCLSSPGPTVQPCCNCDACRCIAEGQDIDVLEIDAASNTGVDNIRELRGNTAYRPARSRFRVYIIDEVHMLSTGAFNALLKTLEEPPEHVKFILATTEIQKVPATIQSRCQRFNFRNIAPEQIGERLAAICKAEGTQAEPAALRRIARLANGSMRDALSILDQLLSVSPTTLTLAALDELLPPLQDEQMLALLQCAVDGDAAGALARADLVLSAGRGLDVFCADLIEVARSLMLMRACGADTALTDVSAAARGDYAAICERFELSHYVQMIAMLEELRRNVRFSAAGRALSDAVVVRIARMQQWSSLEQLLGQAGAAPRSEEKKKVSTPLTPAATPAVRAEARPAAATAAFAADRVSRREVVSSPLAPAAQSTPSAATVSAAEVSVPSSPLSPSAQQAAVAAAPRASTVAAQKLLSAAASASVTPIANAASGTLVGSMAADRAVVLKDPLVRQVIEMFDGVLVNVERSPLQPSPADATE